MLQSIFFNYFDFLLLFLIREYLSINLVTSELRSFGCIIFYRFFLSVGP